MGKLRITIRSKRTGHETTIIDESQTPTIYGAGDLTTGIPFTDTLEDNLETAVMVLRKTQDLKYEPFDLVTVKDLETNIEKHYVISGRHSESDSAYLNKFDTVLNLVEPTKILDTVKIFNLNITDKNLTLKEQLTYLLKNCEVLVGTTTPRFIASFSKVDNTVPGEDFFFENTTLRNALDEMLSVVNQRCKVEKITMTGEAFGRLIVTSVSLTDITDIDYVSDGITYESNDIEQSNYAGSIKARGYNSITRKTVKINNEYFSTNAAALTDQNALADLHYPIEEIKSFVMKNLPLRVACKYTKGNTLKIVEFKTGMLNMPFFGVDIASQIVEESLFNLLAQGEESNTKSQAYYLPYTKGDSVISVNLTYKGMFDITRTNLRNVVKYVVDTQKYYDIAKQLIIDNEPTGYEEIYEDEYISEEETTEYLDYIDTLVVDGISLILDATVNFINTPYDAEFVPRVDTAIEMHKAEEFDSDVLKMSLMESQSAKTLDITRHSRHLLSTIERTGNEEITIDYAIHSLDELFPILGRFKDGKYKDYIVYKREYSIYDNFIKVKYFCSKNYNLIQEKVGVSREYRIFRIPVESNSSPIVVHRNLMLSDQTEVNNVPNYLLKNFYELFGVTNNIAEVSHMFFTTLEAQTQRADGTARTLTFGEKFALPVVKIFTQNSIGFLAFPKDNFNVGFTRGGYEIKLWGGGGVQILYAPYTDSDGKVGYFSTSLGNLNPNTDMSRYPIVSTTQITEEDPLTIYRAKDRTEKPEFTFLTQFKKTQTFDVVFGDLSCLFLDDNKDIQVYFDNRKYLDGEINLSPTATLTTYTNGDFVLVGSTPGNKVKATFTSNGKTVVLAHKNRILCAFNNGIAYDFIHCKLS